MSGSPEEAREVFDRCIDEAALARFERIDAAFEEPFDPARLEAVYPGNDVTGAALAVGTLVVIFSVALGALLVGPWAFEWMCSQ